MKTSKFSEAQILIILKEQESGLTVAEISRKYTISEPCFYSWKKKYGGMEAEGLKRLK